MITAVSIARRHTALPIHKQYPLLKQVLREWKQYSEETPLQSKPTHSATLGIEILRPYTEGGEQKIHRYRKLVPMQLWTAVLPWEVQRGLSLSSLELPPQAAETEKVVVEEEKKDDDNEEEEDPFGVVSPAVGVGEKKGSDALPVASPLTDGRPAPGMLFLMDTHSGLSFWSGAITDPIDVLYVAPVFPSSLQVGGGEMGSSFAGLLSLRQKGRVRDNLISKEMVGRYFPTMELYAPTEVGPADPLSHPQVEWRVVSHSHLDPFPADGSSRERGLNHTTHCDYPGARYIIETKRFLVQENVKQALAESAVAARAELLSPAAKKKDNHASPIIVAGDNAAEVELSLHWSPSLERELVDKAQLSIFYTRSLETVLNHMLKELNKPLAVSGRKGAETPFRNVNEEGKENEGEEAAASGDTNHQERKNNKKIQFWLSEHESVWMTLQELKLFQQQQSRKKDVTNRQAMEQEYVEEEEEKEEEDHYNDMEGGLAPAASPVPSTKTPSESSNAVVMSLSANALERYSNASPNMPLLPPIDYELFDLCLRLGLCTSEVIYYYYPRILREWREDLKELHRLDRSLAEEERNHTDEKGRKEEEEREATKRRLRVQPHEVDIMVTMTTDPSLQLPEELSAVVEALRYKLEKLRL